MTRFVRWVDGRLFAPGTAHRVGAIRAALAFIIALRVGTGPYRQLAGTPNAMFRPAVTFRWMGGFPSLGVIIALQVVGVLAALWVVAGRSPRVAFPVAWASLLLLGASKVALGKILHNDVLLLLACIPFLLAPAEARWRSPEKGARYGWVPRASILIITTSYFAAGVEKLIHSGISWVTGDNMRWIMYSAASTTARAHTTAVAQYIGDHAWLAHLTAAGILGMELVFPIWILLPRWRPLLIVAAVLLHTGTWFTLGLDYWGWSLTVAAVFWNWDRWRVAGTAPTPSPDQRAAPRSTELTPSAP